MADNISFLSTKSGAHTKQKRLRAHVDYDEMTVKYGRISLGVPTGFKACLENVTREVLREQPKDIKAFLACYFQQLTENQRKGISANNLITERIVEVKAFEEQGIQKEEEKIETQDAGNVTDGCQVESTQSQTVANVPAENVGELSFEQQQEIEHEDEDATVQQEDVIEQVTENVKAVCLEDILKQDEYKQTENVMSLEEQEQIDHQSATADQIVPETEVVEAQEEKVKPVCLEQLLKEQEKSQIEENQNPKKIESAPSANKESKESIEQVKHTQSEPAVLSSETQNKTEPEVVAVASEVPSHISLDALPDNIKLVEAIVKTSVTELAEEEQQKQDENAALDKIASVEEVAEEKNGDVEA
jgi:hypothetical protein